MSRTNLTYISKLHNRVIHVEKSKASLRAIYAEEKWVRLLDNNRLISVCKECFKQPT